jgi:hypothetical protein
MELYKQHKLLGVIQIYELVVILFQLICVTICFLGCLVAPGPLQGGCPTQLNEDTHTSYNAAPQQQD